MRLGDFVTADELITQHAVQGVYTKDMANGLLIEVQNVSGDVYICCRDGATVVPDHYLNGDSIRRFINSLREQHCVEWYGYLHSIPIIPLTGISEE